MINYLQTNVIHLTRSNQNFNICKNTCIVKYVTPEYEDLLSVMFFFINSSENIGTLFISGENMDSDKLHSYFSVPLIFTLNKEINICA